MKIHHVGYAVKDLDKAAEIFKFLGFANFGNRTIDDRRGVVIQFLRDDTLLVELIAPLNEKSPIDNFLNKVGPAPYHICYEVENIEAAVILLKNNGFMTLEKPSEAPAISNKKVAFLYHKEIGLVELVEK